jgi:hypothetical protein
VRLHVGRTAGGTTDHNGCRHRPRHAAHRFPAPRLTSPRRRAFGSEHSQARPVDDTPNWAGNTLKVVTTWNLLYFLKASSALLFEDGTTVSAWGAFGRGCRQSEGAIAVDYAMWAASRIASTVQFVTGWERSPGICEGANSRTTTKNLGRTMEGVARRHVSV